MNKTPEINRKFVLRNRKNQHVFNFKENLINGVHKKIIRTLIYSEDI